MTSALLVSGGGRFVDPWHPFGETSAALAAVLRNRGCDVTVSEDADAALATLGQDQRPSLLVLNIGWHGPERFDESATAGLVAALESGLPTLLAHSTLTAFPEWPLWRAIAGGGWTYGTTYHPDYSPGVVLTELDHPVTAGMAPFAIEDERYTQMWVDDQTSEVFLTHEEGGQRHPLAWTRRWGRSPIVADALGHDGHSYGLPGRVALLERELDWLLADGQRPAAAPSAR
ncbi:MAG TPA: ThuA domain-containing protein [Propionibacteriaceae bacterium]|nr:ThuA domain-containing protein [Propionibacteriaceae bacterium]